MSILFNTLVQNRVFFNKMYKRIREQEVTYKKTRQKYGFCIALYSTTKNKIYNLFNFGIQRIFYTQEKELRRFLHFLKLQRRSLSIFAI
jgi:hypothetical protein